MTDFLTEYEALATEIAKEARTVATAFGDRIDALKALTPFYIQKTKGKKPDPGSDDDLPNFETFNSKIHAIK